MNSVPCLQGQEPPTKDFRPRSRRGRVSLSAGACPADSSPSCSTITHFNERLGSLKLAHSFVIAWSFPAPIQTDGGLDASTRPIQSWRNLSRQAILCTQTTERPGCGRRSLESQMCSGCCRLSTSRNSCSCCQGQSTSASQHYGPRERQGINGRSGHDFERSTAVHTAATAKCSLPPFDCGSAGNHCGRNHDGLGVRERPIDGGDRAVRPDDVQCCL